jgi:hypothetical protein
VILKLALEGQERTRWMAVLLGPACPDEEVCPPEEMLSAEEMLPAEEAPPVG